MTNKEKQKLQTHLKNFSAKQKEEILKRDNYRCVICGQGKKEGVELHIEYIKPKELGGNAIIENGQTLCLQHQFLTKNMRPTEIGKEMFLKFHELSQKEGNEKLKKFAADALKVNESHDIDGYDEWKK